MTHKESAQDGDGMIMIANWFLARNTVVLGNEIDTLFFYVYIIYIIYNKFLLMKIYYFYFWEGEHFSVIQVNEGLILIIKFWITWKYANI